MIAGKALRCNRKTTKGCVEGGARYVNWLARGIYHMPLRMAISGCKDRRTERFLAGERVKVFEGFTEAAAKALTRLQAAVVLGDLRSPPSNRFEALKGDRKGEYSIRINQQYRVCFKWAVHRSVPPETDILQAAGDAYDVEITDYH